MAMSSPTGDPQLGLFFQAPARRVWTVRDLVSTVRTAVEREYTDIYVEGEISNYRPAESGHLYFTLKDGDAQLRIVDVPHSSAPAPIQTGKWNADHRPRTPSPSTSLEATPTLR